MELVMFSHSYNKKHLGTNNYNLDYLFTFILGYENMQL